MIAPVPLLAGAVGGAGWAVLIARSARSETRAGLLAVSLGVAAAIYVGFGLFDGRLVQVGVQIAGALPFFVCAIRARSSVGALGIAWLAHVAWDAAHESGVIATRVPAWYPTTCVGWDVVVGGAALVWLRGSSSRGT